MGEGLDYTGGEVAGRWRATVRGIALRHLVGRSHASNADGRVFNAIIIRHFLPSLPFQPSLPAYHTMSPPPSHEPSLPPNTWRVTDGNARPDAVSSCCGCWNAAAAAAAAGGDGSRRRCPWMKKGGRGKREEWALGGRLVGGRPGLSPVKHGCAGGLVLVLVLRWTGVKEEREGGRRRRNQRCTPLASPASSMGYTSLTPQQPLNLTHCNTAEKGRMSSSTRVGSEWRRRREAQQ